MNKLIPLFALLGVVGCTERFTYGPEHWHCTVNEDSYYLEKSYADCVDGDRTMQLVMDHSKESPKWERVVPVTTR